MRWSKLKQRVEENFANNLKSRVSLHSTAYGNCSCGHAWLTLDGEIIANFCTRAHYNRHLYGLKENDSGVSLKNEKRYEDQFVEYGEISRQDVYKACWSFLHELNFDEALTSEDALVQSLAVLDKRLGKRRFDKVRESNLHPLARKLFDTRLSLAAVST